MPALGADMESGTLLEWYVKPGDRVKRGDIVALVDTNKAEIEVEIFDEGVIEELLVAEGARVPVGTVLATIRPLAERNGAPVETPAAVGASRTAEVPAAKTAPPMPEAARKPPRAPMPFVWSPPRLPATKVATLPQDGKRLRVSPVARRAAELLGVDLATVPGSGPDGAITKIDVERVAAATAGKHPGATPPAPPIAAAPAPAREAADRQAAMRKAIAALMERSKREIPHYYLELQIDMSTALAWLHEQNLRRPVAQRLLSSALLLSVVARAVARMPELNGFWVDGAFQPGDAVHLGVAISLRGGGLIAPAVQDADHKTLDELMAAVRDLVARTRAGRLRSSEMSAPTITVTNLGDRGVDLVHGVIYAPQVALVGFGAVRERPWAAEGMLGVRPIVTATLAADHRASDGHTGARFLTIIEQLLQRPEEL